ncbi:hypothetical protein [Deinococcus sp. UYEF24]
MYYQAEAKFGDRQDLAIELGSWEFYADARQSCEAHAAQILGWETPQCGLQEATTERCTYRIVSVYPNNMQQHSKLQEIEHSLQAS